MTNIIDKLVEHHWKQKSKKCIIECDEITYQLIREAIQNSTLNEYLSEIETDQQRMVLLYRGVSIFIKPMEKKISYE